MTGKKSVSGNLSVTEKHKILTDHFLQVSMRSVSGSEPLMGWIPGMRIAGKDRDEDFEVRGKSPNEVISKMFTALTLPGQVLAYTQPYGYARDYQWNEKSRKFEIIGVTGLTPRMK